VTPRGIHDKLDDQDYPAYTMALAAELLGGVFPILLTPI
jgi:hypothetical protein